MKIKNYKIIALLSFMLMACFNMEAQNRYVEEVFTSVKDSADVVYGRNISVLRFPVTGKFDAIDLTADIYMPEGDTIDARPLVIYFHTGNFLPNPINGAVSGTKRDSSVVNICTRLAKMGYVVASATYRLGWNPVDPDQSDRTEGLINAAYRGVQDSRTAVRFFKKTVADGNVFGIDSTKITLWGQGTGGYITLASGALDSYSEIFQDANGVPIQKFLKTDSLRDANCMTIDSTRVIPMVVESINGDLNATQLGRLPANSCLLPGDTLCLPNHVEHTSDFQLVVNMGGAMGDSSWLDNDDVPIISYHTPYDRFAPYNTGVLNVFLPSGGALAIVPVSGSNDVHKIVERNNLNEAMDIVYKDEYTLAAADKWEDGFYPKGLCPLIGSKTEPLFASDVSLDASPWEYWDSTAFCTFIDNYNLARGDSIECNDILTVANLGNPDMSKEKANLFVDTILNFFAPRACLVLDLNCDLSAFEASASNEPVLSASDVGLVLKPNPTPSSFTLEASEPMKDILIYDMSGRLIQSFMDVQTRNQVVQRNGMLNGVYIAQIRFEDGIVTQKVMMQ